MVMQNQSMLSLRRAYFGYLEIDGVIIFLILCISWTKRQIMDIASLLEGCFLS
jgi:hypothetical protein